MSDEPSSSARRETSDARPPVATEATRGANDLEKRQRNRRMFNKKRELFLADLLRNMDILVYAELSTIYYMDCSFLRFILRGFIQFVLLTPKPPIFPDPPQNRPYIGAIFGINIMCLFFHIYMDRPQAGEATRGYLHGGLAMDFIGQKGPTSKLHLALLDVLVLVLQIITLAVFVARQKAKEASMDTSATSSAGLTQTHDFEERGQHQADHDPADIELQSLNPSGAQTNIETGNVTEGESGRDRLLDTTMPPSDAHIFDAFNSGQIIIADLNLIETIRTQFFKYYHGPHEASAGDADFAARVARAGLSFRVRIGNRILGV